MNRYRSTTAQLDARGYLSDGGIAAFRSLPEERLLSLLSSADPKERTAAVRVLGSSGNDAYLPLFCERLKNEKKLYTKIALCEAIERCGDAAIPFLVPLLGAIGTNRHTKPALVDLDKKSYPCPRDIAARILIRLGNSVLPAMERFLEGGDDVQMAEAIDVIGHVAWNFGGQRSEKKLLELYSSTEDELIRWKIVRAFQSFDSVEVVGILSSLAANSNDPILEKEAQRSLARISQRRTGGRTEKT